MHRTRTRTLAAIAGIRPFYGPARRDGGGEGAGSTDGGSAGGGSGTDGTTGDDGQAAKGGQQGDGTGSKTPNIEGEFDKDRYERTLAAAREGEKKARADKKATDERLAAMLKAAGLTPDGKEDPAEQLKAAKAAADQAATKARESAVELTVFRRAGKAGGDPEALIDSKTFQRSVADLDPGAADFDDKVIAAIKAAVKANPKLAAGSTGGGAGRQGHDHSGGTGGKGRSTNLTDAVKRKLAG
jgi:hypothetical protein